MMNCSPVERLVMEWNVLARPCEGALFALCSSEQAAYEIDTCFVLGTAQILALRDNSFGDDGAQAGDVGIFRNPTIQQPLRFIILSLLRRGRQSRSEMHEEALRD